MRDSVTSRRSPMRKRRIARAAASPRRGAPPSCCARPWRTCTRLQPHAQPRPWRKSRDDIAEKQVSTVTNPDEAFRELESAGKHLGTIIAPKNPHNLAWGDEDGKTLYLCALSGVYRMRLNIEGIRPQRGDLRARQRRSTPAGPYCVMLVEALNHRAVH